MLSFLTLTHGLLESGSWTFFGGVPGPWVRSSALQRGGLCFVFTAQALSMALARLVGSF